MAGMQFLIETVLHTDTNLPRVLQAIARGARAAAGGMGKLDESLAMANAKMAQLGMTAGKTTGALEAQSAVVKSHLGGVAGKAGIASKAFVGLGLAAGATFALGVKGAADLQDSVAQLSVATGRSIADVQRSFTPLALNMSKITAMSLPDAMGSVQTLSTFIKNPKALQDPKFLNQIARYADVEFLGEHKVPFKQSIAEAGRVGHMLGAYTAEDIAPVLDKMYRVGYSTPDQVGKIVNQMSYFAEGYTRAGVGKDQIMNLAVLGDLSLGHGKWGNSYDTLLKNLTAPTAPKRRGQIALGLRDSHGSLKSDVLDSSGNLDFIKVMKTVNKSTEHLNGTKALELMGRGFDQTAKRIIELGSSTKNLKFYDQVQASQGKMESLQSAQEKLLNTLNHETQVLTSNFKSLSAILAGPFIDGMTKIVKKMADATGNLASYFSDHPGQAKVAGGALAVAGVAGLIALGRQGMKVFLGITRGHGGSHLHGGVFTHGVEGRAGGKLATVLGDMLKFGPLGRVTGGMGGRLVEAIAPRIPLGIWSRFSSIFGAIAPKLIRSGALLKTLGWFIGHIGLKAIPVIGNVLMLIDVLKFLGKHSHEIGKYIGMAAHWIVAHGLPMLIDAFRELIMGIVNYVKDSVVGIFTGGKGGIFDTIKSLVSGVKEGFGAEDAAKAAAAGVAVHGDIHVHLPAGSTQTQAQALAEHLNKSVGTSRGTRGATPSTPIKNPGFNGPTAAFGF